MVIVVGGFWLGLLLAMMGLVLAAGGPPFPHYRGRDYPIDETLGKDR